MIRMMSEEDLKEFERNVRLVSAPKLNNKYKYLNK